MKKKEIKKMVKKKVEGLVEKKVIEVLSHDFGREDLNLLRDKINELIQAYR